MKVVEIFESMQGEGFWQGVYCTFVRFAGCNLSCSFCDEHTKYVQAKDVDINDIIASCKQMHVVLTGGEPTIQPDLGRLIRLLQKKGYMVHIETNGLIPIEEKDVWITCSPKSQGSFKIATRCDEIKLVVDNDLTIEKAVAIAEEIKTIVYLQPCDGPDIEQSKERIQEWIQREPGYLRAGIQLHKWYGVR